MAEDLAAKLRAADEEKICRAMDQACIDWPINDRAELLDAFNRLLEVLGTPDNEGDVANYEDR